MEGTVLHFCSRAAWPCALRGQGDPPGVACWCPTASAGGKLVHRTPSTTDLQKSLGGKKKSNRRLLLSKTIKCFLMRVAVIYWLFVISPEAPTSMT